MAQEDSGVYAIVEIGGQQQKVSQGEDVFVPLMRQAEKGQKVQYDRVLFVGGGLVKVGAPHVSGSCVRATVLQEEFKGSKVRVFKKKRRKGYHKTIGHRQRYTKLRVDSIELDKR